MSFIVFDESSLDSVRRMEELPLQNWQLLQWLGLRVACPSLGLGPGSCMCGVPAISSTAGLPRELLGVCAYPAPWASLGHSGFHQPLWALRRFSPTGRESGGQKGSGFDLVLLYSIYICQIQGKAHNLALISSLQGPCV